MVTFSGVNGVIARLEAWRRSRSTKADQAGAAIAAMLEKYAKENRPWHDRTGNARKGLWGSHEVMATEISVKLGHGVDYGIYLELARAGKYAILLPTMESNRGAMQSILEKYLLH